MKRLLAPFRMFLLSAFVVTSFSGCAILGAAIQLAGKAIYAFTNNTVNSSPVFLNMSVPITADARGGDGEAVPETTEPTP